MSILRSMLIITLVLCAGLVAAHERIRTARLGLEIHRVEREILRLDAGVRDQRAAVAGLESPAPLEQRALAMGLDLETPKTWNIVNVSRPPAALALKPNSPPLRQARGANPSRPKPGGRQR